MYLRKIQHKMKFIKLPHHHWSKMFLKVTVQLFLHMVQLVQVNFDYEFFHKKSFN